MRAGGIVDRGAWFSYMQPEERFSEGPPGEAAAFSKSGLEIARK
jgi:hypothetical protein